MGVGILPRLSYLLAGAAVETHGDMQAEPQDIDRDVEEQENQCPNAGHLKPCNCVESPDNFCPPIGFHIR